MPNLHNRYISAERKISHKNLEYIQTIIDLRKEHPGCKVTILEIPVYSIVSWNKHSGHKNPEQFTEQDTTVTPPSSMSCHRMVCDDLVS
jgi:hypothetical protein